MGIHATKPVFRVLKKRGSNQSPQLHRQARNWNFACGKSRYDTSQKVNNKGADQTVQAGLHLCCSQSPEDVFSGIEAHMISSMANNADPNQPAFEELGTKCGMIVIKINHK